MRWFDFYSRRRGYYFGVYVIAAAKVAADNAVVRNVPSSGIARCSTQVE